MTTDSILLQGSALAAHAGVLVPPGLNAIVGA
jgi:hypothetical protein